MDKLLTSWWVLPNVCKNVRKSNQTKNQETPTTVEKNALVED